MSEDLELRVRARLLRSPTHADFHGPTSHSAVRARLAELLRDEERLLPVAHFDRLLAGLTDQVAGLG